MAGCDYTTTVKRARADHLLRDHHMLYQRSGRQPVPVHGRELDECLEALRRRNMGSRQRRRDSARASGDGGGATAASPDPSAGAPPPAGMAAGASDQPPSLVELYDEDWGAAVIDLEELESGLELEVPATDLVTSAVRPVHPDLELLPTGIPVGDFTDFLKDKGIYPMEQKAEMARQKFGCLPGDLPRLLLAMLFRS